MKNKIVKIISLLVVLATVASAFAFNAMALSWDGGSADGGGHGTSAGPNGYGIASVNWDNCVGYRFSLVDKTGANKVTKVIDVIRDSHFGRHIFYAADRFTVQRNKKQLIALQNSGFSTSHTYVNCYKEQDYAFATSLPDPSGMVTWQNNVTNLNMVLSLLGAGNISMLVGGDKIIVEPLFDVRLESVYHSLTVTEIALYGKHILGANSDGGSSSNSESWGFIANYVNKHYPNSLFTPDGQGLWDGVSASSTKLSFYNIINKGYGAGIAYTEIKSDFEPTLHLKLCRAYKGSAFVKTYAYGDSVGNHIAYWYKDKGYPVYGDRIFFSVYYPDEDENTHVRQTVWIDGTLIGTRDGYSDGFTWYDVVQKNHTVAASKSYYSVKARVDWIGDSNEVRKYGVEKTFYIPVRPFVTREKVTAFAIDGSTQAYSGSAGSSGKVYFGQKVTFQYKYGAVTTWESFNTVTATADRWNGSSWAHIYSGRTDGNDVNQTNVVLSNTKPYSRNSSIGSYAIPLPAKEDANSYKLKFNMTTAWTTDEKSTTQTSTYYLPVVKSDVALLDMKLVDGNGNYVDRQKLICGDELTVHYFYRNNTDCTVYINGYKGDKTRISGVYAIPSGETITVDGGTITVPDQDSFSVWGGVYLDGVERGNTDYETDGDNNSAIYLCKTIKPEPNLSLIPITPNAPYRETTDVIISYFLTNSSTADVLPSSPAAVRLRIYDKSGALLQIFTKNVICPANDQNIVYFKWTVPTGLNGRDVTVKADILKSGTNYYGETVRLRSTTPYSEFNTPDTRYEEKAPAGFSMPVFPLDSENTAKATWYEYFYENGRFVRKSFGLEIIKSSENGIAPATGETAEMSDGKWYMKSGYGISVSSRIYYSFPSGCAAAASGAFTAPQYGYVLYPEYGYSSASGKMTTLHNDGIYFILPYDPDSGRTHYTPLWFPDGVYAVKIVQTDCWTPAGMLTKEIVPDAITIKGNAYDDWYEGRR